MTRFLTIFAAMLASGTMALAQYTNELENGTNQTVNTDWDIPADNIIVGGSTGNNVLNIESGAVVSNTSSWVGRDVGADNNSVFVDSSGWYNSGDLYVGDGGSTNRLEITNGAYVENAAGFVGAQAGASGNEVIVEGGIWNNEGALTMNAGTSNTVSVSAGGVVASDSLAIGGSNTFNLDDGMLLLRSNFNASTTGFNWNDNGHLSITNGTLSGLIETNGAAILTDNRDVTLNDGSLDLSGRDLAVGYYGSESFLSIENGSTVLNENGYIGSGLNSANNAVLVSGSGSEWRNAGGTLDVGVGAGSENQLFVDDLAWGFVGEVAESNLVSISTNGGFAVASTNGAEMTLNNSAYADIAGGFYVGATNGMTGTVTVQSNSTLKVGALSIESGSQLNLRESGNLNVAGDFDYGDDAAKFGWEDSANLSVGGTLTKTNGLDGTDRTLTIGGDWSPATSTVLSGTNNTLNVNGLLTSTTGIVAGTQSTAVVDGSGSQWINTGILTIAGSNANNSVTVQNGGLVQTDLLDVEDGNKFNLNDGGTLEFTGNFDLTNDSTNLNWNNGGNLSIKGILTGMGSAELVTNGSTNQYTYIDAGRSVMLNGGNWINSNTNLIVGHNTSDSKLAITNAATVVNADGYIGWGSSSVRNSVLVSGTNSLWKNEGGHLYVGVYWDGTTLKSTPSGTANYNELFVEDGAQVFVGETTTNLPGMLVASTNGAQFIVGGGSVNIEDTLYLGQGAASGTNIIRNGGVVTVGDLEIENGYLDLMDGGTFGIRTNFNVQTATTDGFNWREGGHLAVGGILTGMTNSLHGYRDLTLDGSNAVWNVGEDLMVNSGSFIWLQNGASLTNNDAYIDGIARVYGGSGWHTAGDQYIGDTSSSTVVEIYDGSSNIVSGSAYIGSTNSSGNSVEVAGSNSLWRVDGNLLLGNGTGETQNNVLSINSAGQADVGGNLTVYSNNTLGVYSGSTVTVGSNMTVVGGANLGGGGIIQFGDNDSTLSFIERAVTPADIVFNGGTNNNDTVEMLGGSFLIVGSVSNQYKNFEALDMDGGVLYGSGAVDAFDAVSVNNGWISPGDNLSAASLEIKGNFSASNTTYFAEVEQNRADLLVFSDTTPVDLSGLSAEVVVRTNPDGGSATILTCDTNLVNNFTSTTVEDSMLLYDARLDIDYANNKVDVVVEPNDKKFSSALTLAANESVKSSFNAMGGLVATRTKQQRRNLVSTAHSMPHEAYLMANTNAPAGANGPGDQNTIFDMHLWAQYYSGQGSYSPQDNSYGFELNNYGTSFGLDRLIGEALTLGFNYTYANSSARTSNYDQLDATTLWFGAYGEWVNKGGLYLDAMLAYGRSDYDSVRVEEGYYGTSAYRGHNMGGFLDVGQYYHYKNLSLTPYIGLHALTASTDRHEELNGYGDNIQVAESKRKWIESALGLKGRFRFDTLVGRVQATGYAEWLHDFVQDEVQEVLSTEDLAPVSMYAIKPDTDIVNTGLSLGLICTDYMEIGVGYNGRFSEHYEEHTGSLLLDIMF